MNYKEYAPDINPLFICPKFLLEEHFEEQALIYLPVDTGMESECSAPSEWNKGWLDLPGVIENRSTSDEMRLRIPGGLAGFKLIWDICEHFNSKNYILTQSANHYHIDISGKEETIRPVMNDSYLNNFIKKELLSWDHVHQITGSAYIFFKKPNTIEIRCGKMTFNYSEMIKDIVRSHYIVKYIYEYSLNKDYYKHEQLIKQKKEFELKASDVIKNRTILIQM